MPLAPSLIADPTLAERIETTSHDHCAAAAVVALDALLDALDDLRHPDLGDTPL